MPMLNLQDLNNSQAGRKSSFGPRGSSVTRGHTTPPSLLELRKASSPMTAFDPDVLWPVTPPLTPPVTNRSVTKVTPRGGAGDGAGSVRRGESEERARGGPMSSAGESRNQRDSPSHAGAPSVGASQSQNGTSTAYNSSLLGTDPVSSMTMTATPRSSSTHSTGAA